jgi:hypothetical protein
VGELTTHPVQAKPQVLTRYLGHSPACKLDGLGYAIGRRDGVALENEMGSSRKEVWTTEDK